jgi:hypothetical protein
VKKWETMDLHWYGAFYIILLIYLHHSSFNNFFKGDEPTSAVAQKNLQHFDHSFKGELHTVVGSYFGATFGEFKINKRPINIICKGSSFDIIEDVGISARKNVNVSYLEVTFDFFLKKIQFFQFLF